MIPEFHYSVRWRGTGGHPGSHPGMPLGDGQAFAGHRPFLSHPDPRHLDLRASIHDPFGQPWVRSFHQRSAIPVFVLADLSASMGFRGVGNKLENLALFSAAAAYSAYRSGDPFGFVGCDEVLRWELFLPLRLHKGAAAELYERLGRLSPAGRSADGLLQGVPYLGRRRALVFLVSDFHFADDRLDALLEMLVGHDVVPVVLWDSAEYERLPSFGLVHLQDPETGQRRRLFLRPKLRERLQRAFAARKAELRRRCSRYGREPFFLIDRFDADALTRYFHPSGG
ncbi:DUF58 domain-containing protein [Candidatus Methylocalor cossyra]|uniref:DUF58 domain-containing protein n=2 Tax=Candidatus Methylocalor cossyra TaxID=3108543 RepID=A0ABP1CAX0_9GAMM